MRYLKKYNESSKFYHQMSDDDLNDWLEQLSIERDDILEKIASIRSELRNRKERSEEERSKKLPDNVFDLNKEQFDWVFEHGHHTTSKRYEISKKYINQLPGVFQNGFRENTGQFFFSIPTSNSFNETEDDFELKPEVVKSIKFLGENLKKQPGGEVIFGVLYYYSEEYSDYVEYYSEDNIKYGHNYNKSKVTSIEDLLKNLVEKDLDEKESDDW
jgi:hypothetical protein